MLFLNSKTLLLVFAMSMSTDAVDLAAQRPMMVRQPHPPVFKPNHWGPQYGPEIRRCEGTTEDNPRGGCHRAVRLDGAHPQWTRRLMMPPQGCPGCASRPATRCHGVGLRTPGYEPEDRSCRGTAEGHNEEGYYYFFWNRVRPNYNPRGGPGGSLGALFSNGPAGSFVSDFHLLAGSSVDGKGWNPGLYDRKLTYSGFYQVTIDSESDSERGNSSLLVYGWMRNPSIEYRIVESYSGAYNPSGEKKGTMICNGASYDVFVGKKDNGSMIDDGEFWQFYSVRNPPRTFPDGIIDHSNPPEVDIGCHFNGWRDQFDMGLGTSHYIQIVAVENEGNVGRVRAAINAVDPDFIPNEITFDFYPGGPGTESIYEREKAAWLEEQRRRPQDPGMAYINETLDLWRLRED